MFQVIENGIRNSFREHDNVVFESTGLTNYFDIMLGNLGRDFDVVTIGVIADPELCL